MHSTRLAYADLSIMKKQLELSFIVLSSPLRISYTTLFMHLVSYHIVYLSSKNLKFSSPSVRVCEGSCQCPHISRRMGGSVGRPTDAVRSVSEEFRGAWHRVGCKVGHLFAGKWSISHQIWNEVFTVVNQAHLRNEVRGRGFFTADQSRWRGALCLF